MGRKILVTIVRHGETTLNVQRLLQGHTNTPLNEVGMKQAELLGKKIANENFTKVYSSDLIRAFTTATIILQNSVNHQLQIQADKRLRERCYGKVEGKHVQNLFDEAAKRNLGIHDYTPEGGEPVSEVLKRAQSFFEGLCELADDKGMDENILVVSHGGWIQNLMRFLHNSEEKHILDNFNPGKAIKVHRNTARSKLTIEPSSETNENGTQKYCVSFLLIDDVEHLESS